MQVNGLHNAACFVPGAEYGSATSSRSPSTVGNLISMFRSTGLSASNHRRGRLAPAKTVKGRQLIQTLSPWNDHVHRAAQDSTASAM